MRKLGDGYSLRPNPMNTLFSLDLRSARRNAGLTQDDTDHLLGRKGATTYLETAKRQPTIREIITLSLILQKSFEDFYDKMVTSCRDKLKARLCTLPHPKAEHASTYNRKNTLDALASRLLDESEKSHDG